MEDLPLFAAAPPPPPSMTKENPAEKLLAAIAPDELSPREALSLIYELKALLAAKT
jgi:DNA mismatch repair protein MutS